MNLTLPIFEDGEENEGSFKNTTTILAGMTLTTSFCHCILGSIGLGLNGFISYAIATIEELRSQTRYVLFLGMLTGNILSFVNLFLEVVYFCLSPILHNCRLLRALLGLPNVIFFANYLLVLIDNYVAITRNALHRSKFTVRNVIPCQIGFTVVVCGLAKIIYIMGVVALDCAPSFQARMSLITTLVFLIVFCVILKIVIFIKTQRVEIISPVSSLHPNSKNEKNEEIEMEALNRETSNQSPNGSASSTQANVDSGGIRVHATEEAIVKRQREEMKALRYSVLPLLALYVPRIIFVCSTVVCSKMYPAEKEKCNYSEAKPFFTELTSLHGIVQPLIYLWFCNHFWTAWKNRNN